MEERQRYLHEFERRNSKGLRGWLASGNTTSGDPRAYLVEGWADLPVVDWDELKCWAKGPDQHTRRAPP